MKKMKNEIGKYLLQYKDIYNSQIYVHDNIENYFSKDTISNYDSFSLESLGNINSDIIFIEEFLLLDKSNFDSDIKESNDLFKNILKAVDLRYEDIHIIRVKRFKDLNIDNFICKSFNNKIKSSSIKLIVSLGSSFLKKNKNIRELRNKKYNYKNFDLIYTYHPKDLVENNNLKKYSWEDFKFIRDKYLYGE